MFLDELKQWGPNSSSAGRMTLAEAERYCRALAKRHYENFPVLTFVLPRNLRQPFCNVYAFCRWADDLGDEVGDPEQSRQLLAWWLEELEACYRGQARHPVFVALQPTIEQYEISAQPFRDLISAFQQDQVVTEYETFEQLRDYCRRSADPVGRIVLRLCDSDTEENVAWSDSICTGLQLANFWQDVARDYEIGRVYLPREDRLRYGYDDDALQARQTNQAFLDLMRFQVERAAEFLKGGAPLIGTIRGRRMSADIELFIGGGLRILDGIARIGYRVWKTRPTIGKMAMAGLVLRTCAKHLVFGPNR